MCEHRGAFVGCWGAKNQQPWPWINVFSVDVFLHHIFFPVLFFVLASLWLVEPVLLSSSFQCVCMCGAKNKLHNTLYLCLHGQSMRKMGRFIGPIPNKIDTPRLHKIIPFRIFGIYYYHYGMDRLCARYAFVLDSRLPFSFFLFGC